MARPKNTATPAADNAQPATDVVVAQRQAAERSALVLQQFGDGLPYDQHRYEHIAHMHLQRSAEEMLAAGRALLVIREHTAHGEWGNALGRIGLEPRAAQRFMQAAFRFSNASTSTHLIEAAGNKSKLIELMILDDEQLVELNDGGTVAGIDLDDVARMSVSELRKTLRDKNEEHAATQQLIDGKNTRIDTLERDLSAAKRRMTEATIDDKLVALRQELIAEVTAVEGAVRTTLRDGIRQLLEPDMENTTLPGDHRAYASDVLAAINRALADVREEFGLPESNAGGLPAWTDPS